MPSVYDVAQSHRDALLRRDRATTREVIAAYGKAWSSLREEVARLTQQITAARQAGQELPVSWLYERDRLMLLERQVQIEVDTLSRSLEGRIIREQREVTSLAIEHTALQVEAGGASLAFASLPAEAVTSMVGFTANGSPLRSLLAELGPDAARRIRTALINGVASGMSVRDIASATRKAFGGNMARALLVSRTEVLRSYRESAHQVRLQNRSVLRGWVRLAALQANTCAACLSLHGSIHRLEERLKEHPGGRCFPAGVLASGPAPVVATMRPYSGELVTIRTASGALLSCTPNHPILTPRGWFPAHLLQEGDDVVRSTFGEGAPAQVRPDDYQVPTRIEEIAESLGCTSESASSVVPCTAEQFHGDGGGSQVYVVGAHRLLRHGGYTAVSEPPVEQGLSSRSLPQAFSRQSFNGLGPEQFGREWDGLPPDRILSDTDAPQVLFAGSVLRKQAIGRSLVTSRNASLTKAHGNDVPRHTECLCDGVFRLAVRVAHDDLSVRQPHALPLGGARFLGDDAIATLPIPHQPASLDRIRKSLVADVEAGSEHLHALARGVSLDRILDISIRRFSGHVYNLQTSASWYIANGVVVHNCVAVPLVRGDDFAVESGEAWFDAQDERTKSLVLGKAGAKAYEAGAVTLRDFVGLKRSREWGDANYARSLKQVLGRKEAREWARA